MLDRAINRRWKQRPWQCLHHWLFKKQAGLARLSTHLLWTHFLAACFEIRTGGLARVVQAGLWYRCRILCRCGVPGVFCCLLLVPPPAAVAQYFSLDQGDDPKTPGCVCVYSLPDCKGPISGRIVDECYPQDGITLQENTMRQSCEQGEQKSYNCEEELGKGARCELQTVDCCGVTTRSARCVPPGAVLGLGNS